jgi:hypothetical protein
VTTALQKGRLLIAALLPPNALRRMRAIAHAFALATMFHDCATPQRRCAAPKQACTALEI